MINHLGSFIMFELRGCGVHMVGVGYARRGAIILDA